MGWVYWLGSVTLAPVETEAALQYADKYINEGLGFHLVHEVAGQTVLTSAGYGVAAVLMLAFTVINLYGAKRLSNQHQCGVAGLFAPLGFVARMRASGDEELPA
jgi:amino acid transporter